MIPLLSFAALAGQDFVKVIIQLLIIGIVFGILLWIASTAPIPDPFKKIVIWIVYVIGGLFLINWLLGFAGQSFIVF